MYSLTSFKSLSTSDPVRFEMDPAAVAEAEVDRGAPAGRLSFHRLNCPQAAEDLVEPLLLPAIVPVTMDASALLQVLGGPVELAAILEDRRQ